ncbi:hypothetical protein SDC9_198237 [bioreactor metagenome]|uniref:Uncharacterized protein n=1 Tax=bioreactor metagenome TaxID=1076179 RepID=A0A645IHY8_9ZZZZ
MGDDHAAAHQVWRHQADEGDHAGLSHRATGGERHQAHQQQPHSWQVQTEAERAGFAQHQSIERAREQHRHRQD